MGAYASGGGGPLPAALSCGARKQSSRLEPSAEQRVRVRRLWMRSIESERTSPRAWSARTPSRLIYLAAVLGPERLQKRTCNRAADCGMIQGARAAGGSCTSAGTSPFIPDTPCPCVPVTH